MYLHSFLFLIYYYSLGGMIIPKVSKYLCRGKDCSAFKLRYPREELFKYKKRYYCEDCYRQLVPLSKYRRNIWLIFKKIFNLDFKEMPKFVELQLNKYIDEYGFTEEGIFNTLSYIYLEYDFDKLNYKYGLFPVVREYELHKDFHFKGKTKLNKINKNVVHTSLKPSHNNVKEIDELRLNDNE